MSARYRRGQVSISTMIVIGILLVANGLLLFVVSTSPSLFPTQNPNQVAIVFATGGLDDGSINDGVYKGAIDARSDHDFSFTYVAPTFRSDYEAALTGFALHSQFIEPYELIIAVGPDQEIALQTVAEEFPNQKFAIVDWFIDPIAYPNVASLLFDEHEGSAVVGAIAGLYTITDKIGFIGALNIPLVNKYAAGYVFGASHVNPNINGTENINTNVSVAYTNDWVDATTGQTLADSMYDSGFDIVFAAAGRAGLGVFDSVKDKNSTSSTNLWCIGSDSPQMSFGTADPFDPVAPTLCLTSMLKRYDIAVYTIIENCVIDGIWTTGFDLLYSFNLANNGVGYEINTDLLTLDSAIIVEVEAFKALIINGTVVVPDGIFWT